MDLFEQATNEQGMENQPLAYRMRPRTLDEYIGQEHIIGKGRLLRRAIQADQLSSVIFYGPPGTGKTTLARVIANTTKSHFATLNAVLSGVKELRYEIDQAKSRLDHWNQRTILFVDEVHRWNKSQQDALLPWVENGTCILIGATTENPYFEVNAALVSRSRIFQLQPLTDLDLMNIAKQALADKERGYGNFQVSFEAGALEHLVDIANGDARSLLNALQLAVETSSDAFPPPAGTVIYISKEAAEESIQRKVVLYDKEGDYHFDVISAFIKSLRGSDPDAALYWLARMVHAGEDPRFIFRRMMISACEDVGLADPMAIAVVEADASAYERIGLPEGRFHLTHAALYLATAPKSNSALGFFDALQAVEDEAKAEVPNHLKDGNRDAKGFGHGEGYLYPHAYRDHWVAQQYLPNALQGKVFYQPGQLGYEAKVHDDVLRRREAQLESASSDAFPENLTYSPEDKKRMQWIQRTTSERGELLQRLRDKLYGNLTLLRHSRVLVVNAGHGLLLWEAFRHTPEGLVVGFARSKEQYDHLKHYADTLDKLMQPLLYQGEAIDLLPQLEEGLRFEAIVGRNLLSRLPKDKDVIPLLKARLADDGVVSIAETVPSGGSRLSHFITGGHQELFAQLSKAEELIYSDKDNPLTSWADQDLNAAFESEGFAVETYPEDDTELRVITAEDIERWITRSYGPALEKAGESLDFGQFIAELTPLLADKTVRWKHRIVVLKAQRKHDEKPNSKSKNASIHSSGKKTSLDGNGAEAWKEAEAKTHR